MSCRNLKLVDEYNENMECFQKVSRCALNDRICRGTDGVCTKYEEIKEEVKQEAKDMDKQKEEEEAEEEEAMEEEGD